MKNEDATVTLSKNLIDRGVFLETGFSAFCNFIIDTKRFPKYQVELLRIAFMAGAEHTFSTLFAILEEGEEPTENDLNRIALINNEIQVWREKLQEIVKRKSH